MADAASALAILDRLGFRVAIIYEKRREEWHFGDCVVSLDELPQSGWYVEIEGPTPEAVQRVRGRLGLTEAPCEPETYVHLAERHGQMQSDGTRRLLFQPD